MYPTDPNMFRRFAAAASMRMSFGGAPAPHLRHRSLTTVKAASAGRLDSCSPPPRAQRPAHRPARPRQPYPCSPTPAVLPSPRSPHVRLQARAPPHGQPTAGRLALACRLALGASPRPRHARSEKRRSAPGRPMGWAAPVGCADQFVRPNHHSPSPSGRRCGLLCSPPLILDAVCPTSRS